MGEQIGIEVGFNKNDPRYLLYRVEGCEGGNDCKHKPSRCAVRWDTYKWHSTLILEKESGAIA